MPTTITIDALRARGACASDLDRALRLHADGVVTLAPSNVAPLRAEGVNLLWSLRLLAQAHQIELAKAWFDRALTGQSPSWKAATRALIDAPVLATADADLAARLADRTAATTELDRAVAGVGYGYNWVVKRYAEGALADSGDMLGAYVVLAQWAARCAAAVETGDRELIIQDFEADVFAKLDQYGVAS